MLLVLFNNLFIFMLRPCQYYITSQSNLTFNRSILSATLTGTFDLCRSFRPNTKSTEALADNLQWGETYCIIRHHLSGRQRQGVQTLFSRCFCPFRRSVKWRRTAVLCHSIDYGHRIYHSPRRLGAYPCPKSGPDSLGKSATISA